MSENNNTVIDGNTGETGNTTPQEGEKTFTQDELNKIVSDRLAKEKAKADGVLAEKEKELAQREFKLNALSTLREKDLPDSLFDALNTTDTASFNKAVEAIEDLLTAKNEKKPVPRVVAPCHGIPEQSTMQHIRKAMGLSQS